MELWSATGQRFTTTGSTQNFMRTRDGVSVSDDFQIAPKTTGLQRSKMLVGFGPESAGLRQHSPRHLESCLLCRVDQMSNNTNWHTYRFEAGVDTAYVPRARRAHIKSRVLAACRSSPLTTCSWARIEHQSPSQMVMTG